MLTPFFFRKVSRHNFQQEHFFALFILLNSFMLFLPIFQTVYEGKILLECMNLCSSHVFF